MTPCSKLLQNIVLVAFLLSFADPGDVYAGSDYRADGRDILQVFTNDRLSFVPSGNYNPRKQVGIYSADNITIYTGNYAGLNEYFEDLHNYNVEPLPGAGGGINYRTALTENIFLFSAAGFKNQKFALHGDEDVTLIYDTGPVEGDILHHLNYEIFTVNTELAIGRNFWKGLFAMTGLSMNFYAGRSLKYEMELDTPGDDVFENTMSKDFNLGEQNMPDENFYSVSFLIAAGYRFPLIRLENYGDISITPYFSVHNNLGGHGGNFRSNLTSLESCLSVEYSFEEKSKKPVEASVSISYNNIGRPRDDFFRIGRQITQNNLPLINLIFFDKENRDIPNRYIRLSKEEAAGFYESDINSDNALEVYRHILNIIGRRMKSNADTEITLTRFAVDEPENADRSFRKNAEFIKYYLTDIWDIEGNRITVDSVPTLTKDRNYPFEHIAVRTNNSSLFSPVAVYDTVETVRCKEVVFDIDISDSKLNTWNFQAQCCKDSVYYTSRTVSDRNSVIMRIDTLISPDAYRKTQMAYSLSVDGGIDYKDLQLTGTTPFNIANEERKTRRYFLVWLNNYDFTVRDMVFMPEAAVRKAYMSDKKITFNAYAETSLSERLGRIIAERRISEIVDAIGIGKKAEINVIVPEKPIFSEEYPEGAIYNRLVEIIIEEK